VVKSLKVTGDGKNVAIYEFGDIIKPNPDWQGTTINLGATGPKIKDGLVGMAGAYIHPSMVGATSCESVVESWNWLFNQFKSDRAELETHIELAHILMFIGTGVYEMVLNRMMNLAVNLKTLHDRGIDAGEKISELDKKIRGNTKAFKQFKENDVGEGLIRLKVMIDQISDMLSESEIALVAIKNSMSVVLGKSPDLLIDGVRIEVKHFRTDRIDEGALSNKILEGLSQGGEVIAISSSSLRSKNCESLTSSGCRQTRSQVR
jgi:hypothetical protein